MGACSYSYGGDEEPGTINLAVSLNDGYFSLNSNCGVVCAIFHAGAI